ncbi:hypothetical protein AB3R30_03520 [Leptolyngbyaceae cyanobacterium UHCC 1019]
MFRSVQVMKIQTTVTLECEEFEPVLIELLSKGLNRQITREEIKTINLNYGHGKPAQLTATLELLPAQ